MKSTRKMTLSRAFITRSTVSRLSSSTAYIEHEVDDRQHRQDRR